MKRLLAMMLQLTSSFLMPTHSYSESPSEYNSASLLQTEASESLSSAQTPQVKTALRTNLLYWLAGMPNIGVELTLDNSPLGVLLNGGYSPLGGKNWEYAAGGWYIAPEVRCYLFSAQKFFVGAQFLAQGYNYKLSETGYQGDLIGGGVTCGYKLTLSDNFDMDFTAGVGYASLSYDTYYHSNGINVYKEKSVTKSGIMPLQAGVNLIWKIK